MADWHGTITLFSSERATSGEAIGLDFAGLVDFLKEPVVSAEKTGQRTFLPGTLVPGGKRRKEDVSELCLLCLDFDHGGMPEEYVELWQTYTHVVVSTHGHTAREPRYRAIFPLSKPVSAGEWSSFYRHASTLLSRGMADTSTIDASRIWYVPTCPEARLSEHIFTVSEGELLDPSTFSNPSKREVQFTKPSEALNNSVDWREILEPNGWQFVRANGNSEYWARAGKPISDGHSAVLHTGKDGVFYNFSSAAHPLAANRAYTKFALFATLNHRGDFKLAAKAIRKKFRVASTRAKASNAPPGNASSVLSELIGEFVTEFLNGMDGEQYVRVTTESGSRLMAVSSSDFVDFLTLRYKERTGAYCPPDAIERSKRFCCAEARETSPLPVWNRIGVAASEVVWDLGTREPKYVRMTADGWEIVNDAGILMYRPPGLLPLPEPERDGKIAALREFVNCGDENSWVLFCAYLVGVFFPDTAVPLMLVTGEQGSGKSGLARIIKWVLDPSVNDLQRPPKDDRTWQAYIANNYVLALDNLSRISTDQSDAMCSLSTEGTFAARALYTNKDVSYIRARRPVVITSIERVAERADLSSRAITLKLPSLVGSYRTERDIKERFTMALPQVMGALCDAVCQALRARDGVPVVKDVRMNDFLCNAVAAETSFGFSAGSVLLAYRSMLQDSTADAIENDLLADAIIAIADECSGQELTAREVLKRAKDEIVDDTAKLPAANQLHKWIDRWTPVLRQAGVEITRLQRRGNKRPYVIRRLPASDDTIDDTPHVFDQSSPSIEPDHDDSDDSDDMAIVSLTECYGDEKRDHGSMGMFIR